MRTARKAGTTRLHHGRYAATCLECGVLTPATYVIEANALEMAEIHQLGTTHHPMAKARRLINEYVPRPR